MKIKICKNCGNAFNAKDKRQLFCCRSCSTTYNNKHRILKTKRKINNINTDFSKRKKNRVCLVCGRVFLYTKGINTKKMCSMECSLEYKKNRKKYLNKDSIEKISQTARNTCASLQNIKRSKNEIMFYSLCKEYFNNVEHNKNIFNGWDADVIIYDYKIAVLWNGPWHYKEICKNTSLLQIQKRDEIKINEIHKLGFIPYVIKDLGSFSAEKVTIEFLKLQLFVKNIGM